MSSFKLILLIIFLFFLNGFAISQDNIEIYSSLYPVDSISICKGDTVDFYAVGTTTVVNSDFNSGDMGVGWSSYSTPDFKNPCISHPNGSTYIWMDTGPMTAPRQLITKDFNTTGGGIISFDLVFAEQFGINPCEGPDVDYEGVSLQYSNDNGSTWGDIVYFCPNGDTMLSNPMTNGTTSSPTVFCSWDNYSFLIPMGAQTPSTRFRWIQIYFNTPPSGIHQDTWGLDNIKIKLNINDVRWSHGEIVINPPSINPHITSSYTVYALSHCVGSNDTITFDDIKIKVYDPIRINVDSATICQGEQVSFYVIGGCQEYLWSTGSMDSWITVKPDYDSVFSVILTDVYGCINTDTTYVFVNQLPIIEIENDTMCIGDIEILVASGGNDYLWSTGDTTQHLLHTADVNDLYVVVTGDNGCTSIREVVINPLPTIMISPDGVICYGEHVELNVSGGDKYFWSNGSTSNTLITSPISDTMFTVIVIDINRCINYDTVKILTNPFHELFVSTVDDTICRGEETHLEVIGASEYLWSTGENMSLIKVYPYYNTLYSVTGYVTYNNLICSLTESINIVVEICNTCFIPNAFSPKKFNNVFKPEGELYNISNYSFIIFDRVGKILFETNNYNIGWDGTINGSYAPIGVYVYKIQYVNKIHEEFRVVGSVTIIK